MFLEDVPFSNKEKSIKLNHNILRQKKEEKRMNKSLLKEVFFIAIPVALQCMLQSSFSIIDQLMIGQLGTVSIAAVGLAGKFVSLFTVVSGAVATVTGIMIAQNIGAKDEDEALRSFSVNLLVMMIVAALFTIPAIIFPHQIMKIYSNEPNIVQESSKYLATIAVSFIPLAINTCSATMFRCMDDAKKPLYVSIFTALLNTVLNYLFIFGKFKLPQMQIKGAALASSISTLVSMIITICMLHKLLKKHNMHFRFSFHLEKMSYKEYLIILMPILVNEFLWSLGENIYGIIYGHLGSEPCAAMTLTYPIQGLLIGALSGISSAAGIIIGKKLGQKDFATAYKNSKSLILYGFLGSIALSAVLILSKNLYVSLYQVEPQVKQLGSQLLVIFAFYLPVKVSNMVLGGGILRSGGNTKLILFVDLIGTWVIGVPLGLFTSFVLKFPISLIYAILSIEEIVRLIITFVLFKRKTWMRSI